MNRKAGTRVKASAGSEDYFFFFKHDPQEQDGPQLGTSFTLRKDRKHH